MRERESGPRGGKIDPKMLRWRRNFIGAALGPLTLFLCFYLSFNIVSPPLTVLFFFLYIHRQALLIYLRKNIRKEKIINHGESNLCDCHFFFHCAGEPHLNLDSYKWYFHYLFTSFTERGDSYEKHTDQLNKRPFHTNCMKST